jgi:hypothetical protein
VTVRALRGESVYGETSHVGDTVNTVDRPYHKRWLVHDADGSRSYSRDPPAYGVNAEFQAWLQGLTPKAPE